MKLFSHLTCAFVLLAAATGVFAAATPLPSKTPATSLATLPLEPLPQPAPEPPVSSLKFNDYINDLAGTLKLSDADTNTIADLYQADGAQLQTILNSDSISPLEQDRQVSDLRAARNAKIEALLGSNDRFAAFLKVEAKYRVALIELAADGGLIPPAPAGSAPPAPAPAPAAAPNPAPAPAAPVSARPPPPE